MTLQKWSTHQKTRRGQTSHLPNIHWELGKFQQSNQSLFGSQRDPRCRESLAPRSYRISILGFPGTWKNGVERRTIATAAVLCDLQVGSDQNPCAPSSWPVAASWNSEKWFIEPRRVPISWALECPWPRAPFQRVGFANNHSNSKKQLPSTGTSHTLSSRFYFSCSFGVPWCTSLNFCPRNRGALGQMMLGRPMGLTISKHCKHVRASCGQCH